MSDTIEETSWVQRFVDRACAEGPRPLKDEGLSPRSATETTSDIELLFEILAHAPPEAMPIVQDAARYALERHAERKKAATPDAQRIPDPIEVAARGLG